MSSSISSTAWLAPPCEGPDRALMPEAMLAKMSAFEEPTTRTVAVEQLSSWSACRMSNRSTALWKSSPSSPSTRPRSEEHTSELQSRGHLVCRLLLEKKKETEQ